VNSRNMIRTAALAAACLLGTVAVRAQAAAGTATGTKIGVINVRQAIVTTAEGKQASAELQTQFAPRQSELEGMNKQINDLRQRLQASSATLSEEEKARLTTQGQRMAAQLERKNNELQEDVNAAQGEVVDKIGRKMMDILDRYARENGFVVILDSSSQNTPILYASTNIDVTPEIIKQYDATYPAKGGAAAKPAATTAPKPAAPATTTQKPAAPATTPKPQ
jgi:outer membrane protein